jgi:hypothetical protein
MTGPRVSRLDVVCRSMNAHVGCGEAGPPTSLMARLRYLFYAGLLTAALTLWAAYFVLVLGIPASPARSACLFEAAGCFGPTWAGQLLDALSIFGATPLTVLLFVIFRSWVRRLFGLDAGQDSMARRQ